MGTVTDNYMRIRGSLRTEERLEYIKAVQCIMSAPPQTPESVAPGAKTRFDDFVAVHINETLAIHCEHTVILCSKYMKYLSTFLSFETRFYSWDFG